MLLPCEIAVKCLLPSVRAIMAKTLTTKHNLTQMEAAKLLGISQPAISLYDRRRRGKAINLESEPEILKLIENLAEALAKGDLSHKEFVPMFCDVCRTIRAKGLMCKLHKTFDPDIDIEKCVLCSVITTKCM